MLTMIILIVLLLLLIGMKIGLNLGYCIVQDNREEDTKTDKVLRKLMKIF
jgi:hypothetical protein